MSGKKTDLLLLASVLLVVGSGCSTNGPAVPPAGEGGYKAFPTARDFDPPGQMYRVDKQGVTYPVTTLKVKVDKGSDVIPTRKSNSQIGITTLLQTVGATACSPTGNASVSRTGNVVVESTDGEREFTQDDSGVLKLAAKWLEDNGYDRTNKYYVIRETISTKKVKYSAETAWLASLGVDACLEQAAKVDVQFSFSRGASVELDRTFTSPYRIWYKSERLDPKSGPGIGPKNIPIFELVDAPEFDAPVRQRQ